jgi:hypothetical protein
MPQSGSRFSFGQLCSFSTILASRHRGTHSAGGKAMIVIDDEFQNLIPPLSPVERARLEENLREAGRARNPLVVWPVDGKQILLDGHNRYDICTEYGLAYDVHEIEFADRSEAEQWMLKEQLGRRNLDPVIASELRGRLYNSRKTSQGGEQKIK